MPGHVVLKKHEQLGTTLHVISTSWWLMKHEFLNLLQKHPFLVNALTLHHVGFFLKFCFLVARGDSHGLFFTRTILTINAQF